MEPYRPEPSYLTRLADGTVKQRNPFTGTEVWTVAGRAHRPLGLPTPQPLPLHDADFVAYCPFCPDRVLETPPEKARMCREGDHWWLAHRVEIDEVIGRTAEFRRVPNLFEILNFDYWRQNYGYSLLPELAQWRERYMSSPTGRQHIQRVVGSKLRAAGWTDAKVASLGPAELLEQSAGFFGGSHDVIIARRHFVDGAQRTTQLAGSGTLSVDEHARFIEFTIDSCREVYEQNPYVRYVAVFQNWLKPAGSSLDHLHKQLVGIDERGPRNDTTLPKLRYNPNLFNEAAVNYAIYHNLVIAENDHAVAFAGFGHRYPTIEIYSKSAECDPWKQSPDEVRGMSDLLHAMHAATGAEVPTNEEWHYRPTDVTERMPWRIMLKWRVSTMAGFEGGTEIYLNTIDPWNLRQRIVDRLHELRDRLAPMRVADECGRVPNVLRYHQG